MSEITRPRLTLTFGDPSGIGPELAVKLLSNPDNLAKADVSILATVEEVEAAAAEAGVVVPLAETPDAEHAAAVGSKLSGTEVARGEATQAGGERALTDLRTALDRYHAGEADAIVFTPLNKSALHMAGMHEEDELRWFAKELDFEGTTSEINVSPEIITSRVTSHVALKDVSAGVTAARVAAVIRLLNDVVRDARTEKPRLAVCALNPHNGENGQFGTEEIDHIAPGIALAQHEGIDVEGPFPSDTIFLRARGGNYDGIVTMYHDQGQIALKLMGFDQGVTVQGGLPVPIATPAHGTAYEIVGQGIAEVRPTQNAFDFAVAMASRR